VRTRLFACIAATALAFGGVAGAADARARHKHSQHSRPASFDGSCDFSGAVTFTPPMTTSSQPIAQHADAPGACSGTFVDGRGRTHQLDHATPLIRLDGKSGGGAWMPVTPAQSSDPVAAAQACNGAGLERFDLDAHLQTDGALRG
jgi:hypothetical protein